MKTTNRFWRILRHRWLDDSDVRRALDRQAMDRIQARIAASERRHSGEIRVCVEAGLPLSYLWRGASARVWDTEANNGVLIYLLLAEHAIEIVADRGAARYVGPDHWQHIVHGMREHFRAGRFEPGLMQAVEAVDALLATHFPLAEAAVNPNELPDRPHVSG
jgi:uncharacterized membrane protein